MSRRNKKKREIKKQIQSLKAVSLFLTLVITVLSTSIFLVSKNLKTDAQVKGESTFAINNKVNTSSYTNYFSDILGIEFVYDNTIFTISENSNYITLSTLNGSLPFKAGTIRKVKDKDIKDIYPDLKYSETINDNGVGRTLFSYSIPSIIKEEKEETKYLTVIHKYFPNNITIYMQIWGYNFKDDLRTTRVLTELMESLTLATQKSKTSGVLSATSSIVNQAQILGQASTVRIYSQKCNNVKFSDSLKPLSVGGNTYTLCATTLGSGFVINDRGYVVTNAHIADYNDFDLLLEGSSTDGSYEDDMVNDLIILMLSALNNSTQEISEDEMANLAYSYLLEMYDNNYISISNLSRDIYIQSNATFEIDEKTAALKNKEKHIKADLVKSNKISSTYESQISQNTNLADTADLAVIQTADTLNLPSIPIEKNISIGKKVFVIGYPGLADNSELVSSTQVLSSTVTEGSVSAIKPNSSNTFELIQIDAAVQNGNSGGPIVNEDGYAVGIATYKLRSDSGNYNFGISAKELSSFLETASIQPQSNSMRKSLENSLSDMSASHYKSAYDNLQAMLISQPALATTIQPLIDLCSSKIATGEDKTSIIDLNSQTTKILIVVILVVLLIATVVLLSINLKKISDKQKQLPQSKLNTQSI